MGRTVTIRFKNNRVVSVSGALTPGEMAGAAAWGQAFVDSATAKPTEEDVSKAAEKLTAPDAPPIEGPKPRKRKAH